MSDWIDPDDAPPLTPALARRAEMAVGDKVIRPTTRTIRRAGRPPLGGESKRQVTLRLDPDIIERFRSGGPGWQSRINDALRKAAGLG